MAGFDTIEVQEENASTFTIWMVHGRGDLIDLYSSKLIGLYVGDLIYCVA